MLLVLLSLLSVFTVVTPHEFVAEPTNFSRIARNSMATCETYFVDALLANDLTNSNNVPPTGYSRLACSGWAGCSSTPAASQQDLNRGKAGRNIYLYVKTQSYCPGDTGSYITDIEVLVGDKQCSSGFTSPSGLGRYDLNTATGGDNIYLCVKKESLGSKNVLSDWGVYSTAPSPNTFSTTSADLNKGVAGADSITWGWSKAACPATCFNGGICTKSGTCGCRDGFSGPRCNLCATGYYSYPQCVSCDAATNCTSHGSCASDGSCTCSTGFTGNKCEKCATNYYDYPNCVQCTAAGKCSSHGTCSSKGSCTCNTGYQGTNCDQCAPGYYGYPTCVACDADSKCSSHGTCASDGSCACSEQFDGDNCGECAPGYYGYPACVECDAKTKCNANGQCADDGSCSCSDGYQGDFCDECTEGFYGYPYCAQCDADTSCNAHGTCGDEGSCECNPEYIGDSCSQCSEDHYDYPNCVFCRADATCSSHGECTEDGLCSCDDTFDGADCGQCAADHYDFPNCVYCDADATCSSNGVCSDEGTCSCNEGFAGANCGECAADHYGYPGCVECIASTDCNGNGVCSQTDGSCDCQPSYTGTDCGSCNTDHYAYPICRYCDAENTCSGNGHCGEDGLCVCDPTFTGASCDQCAIGYVIYPSCIPCSSATNCSSNGFCEADGTCECSVGYSGEHCDQCDSSRLIYPTCYPRLSTANYIFSKAAFNNGKLTIVDTNGMVGAATLKDVAISTPQTSGFVFSGATITGVAGAAGLCLDVFLGSLKAGSTVGSYKCNGQNNQKWTYSGTSGDWAEIRPASAQTLCLGTTGGKSVAGTGLILQKCDGSYNQQWSRSSSTPPPVPVNIRIVTSTEKNDANSLNAYKNAFAATSGAAASLININVVPSDSEGTYLLDASFTANVAILSTDSYRQLQNGAAQAVHSVDKYASVLGVQGVRVAPIIEAGYNYIFNKAAYEANTYRVFTTTSTYESTLKAPADDPSGVFMFSSTSIKTKSGLCLDISRSAIKAGSAVGVFKCKSQANQKWVYGTTDVWAPIQPASDKTLCLAPEGLQTCNGGKNQLWKRSADAPPVAIVA